MDLYFSIDFDPKVQCICDTITIIISLFCKKIYVVPLSLTMRQLQGRFQMPLASISAIDKWPVIASGQLTYS